MSSYRLLRSNKESGPYSLNDLVSLGLKPYDLIWVEGRSAAWRYPSEVAELKDFAPAIEEQPYDRFYKRSSETEKAVETPAQEISIAQRVTIPSQTNFIKEVTPKEERAQRAQVPPVGDLFEVKKEEPIKKITPEIPAPFPSYQPQPKKKIFVSMPETNAFEQNLDQNKRDQYNDDKYQQYLPKAKPVQENPSPVQITQAPREEKSYSPIDIHESGEAKLETKYTQSLDDIKEMYINTLVQRKTKNRRKEILRQYVKPALLPLILLLSGVAIGFVINNRKGSPKAIQSVSTVVPSPTTPQQKNDEEPTDNKQAAVDNKMLQPDAKQDLAVATETKKLKSTPPTEVVIQSQKKNKKTLSFPKAVVPDKKQQPRVFVPDDEISTVQKKNVEVDPSTGERKKVVRDDEIDTRQNDVANNNLPRPIKKNNSERSFLETDRRNIRDFVTVRSNNYIRGPFGGIRGLELTVYNNSGFLLDEVSVELQIMKPSEQPLRTDIITFRNISANGAVTVRVPDSQRGIRVDYRITSVESKQWEKNTAGL